MTVRFFFLECSHGQQGCDKNNGGVAGGRGWSERNPPISFTHSLTTPSIFYSHRWQGYIKDYDGGTLMEYVMFPQIRYTQFPAIIHEQRCALDARLRAVSHMHVIHKVGWPFIG